MKKQAVLLWITLGFCFAQISMNPLGDLIITTAFQNGNQSNLNIASPLVLDLSGPTDVASLLSTYGNSIAAAKHISLFNLESRNYQSISTAYPRGIVSFSINGASYLAVGSSGANGVTIFQWDPVNVQLVSIQNIPTNSTLTLSFVFYQNYNFLFRSSVDGNGEVYNWTGNSFTLFQQFGDGSYHYEPCFVLLNGQPYLELLANGPPGITPWTFSGRFVSSKQNINGITGAGYISRCYQVGGIIYLTAGLFNSATNTGSVVTIPWTPGTTISAILSWDNLKMKTVWNATGVIPTSIKVFNAFSSGANNTYLVVSGNLPGNTVVYQSFNNGTYGQFFTNPLIALAKANTSDVEVFTIDTTTYLLQAVADGMGTPSYFYRFNSNLNTFDALNSIQNQPLGSGVTAVTSTILSGTRYLFAGYNGTSRLFRLL